MAPPQILHVAEKNDAARHITEFLSSGQFRVHRKKEDRHNTNYFFGLKKQYHSDLLFNGFESELKSENAFTSVSGHLLQYEFADRFSDWQNSRPEELFHCPIEKKVCREDNHFIIENIENLAREADFLIIWTDCDREGENIGVQMGCGLGIFLGTCRRDFGMKSVF